MKILFAWCLVSFLISAYSDARAASEGPPPALPAYYLVFFDAQSATLTSEALRVIDLAAAAFKQTPSAKVEVIGRDDTARTVAESKALSLRRAEAVARALVAQGVPQEAIVILGVGQDPQEQLLPIPPNTAEPQDRNVRIHILPPGTQPRPDARPFK